MDKRLIDLDEMEMITGKDIEIRITTAEVINPYGIAVFEKSI
jgi:hypothetical protein